MSQLNKVESLKFANLKDVEELAESQHHRNIPTAEEKCLYGLVGDVALAGSDGNETNPFAIALNFLSYISCALGRGIYLPVGNTTHHPRLFGLHVGRSGRGRKGDSLSLVMKIHEAINLLAPGVGPQVHRGGLSSREGLATLIHDGFKQGSHDVPAIDDKRLWVIESEFANVLQQGRRQGNTLSTALRDCWDGVCIKPATKTNRVFASRPHVCMSGAITPDELTALLGSREVSNGFANRFLIIWAERTRITAFPKSTPNATIVELAKRTLSVLNFAKAGGLSHKENQIQMAMTPEAKSHYNAIYTDQLSTDHGIERVNAMLERRAPLLLRLAMVFAICDKTSHIDTKHLDAANAWIRYFTESVQFVFTTASESVRTTEAIEHAHSVLEFLSQRITATRSDISRHCFKGHVSKSKIDCCLNHLLSTSPPQIKVEKMLRSDQKPGAPRHLYSLT
jgi:putative DNA primase/helicase